MSPMLPPALTPRHRRAVVGALIATGLVGLTACGQQGSEAGAPDATSTVTSSLNSSDATASEDASDSVEPTADVDEGASLLGTPGTDRVMHASENPGELVVEAIRTAHHDDFDRVVFELSGQGDPGWLVNYDGAVTQQASGHPIEYAGATALNVNIDGTPYPIDAATPPPELETVNGEAGSLITEVIPAGAFEARSQFIIGVEREVPFSVTHLSNPTRVVIDFQR